MRFASRWIAALLLCLPSLGHADDVASVLGSYETEARQLATLPSTSQSAGQSPARRLLDGQIAFSFGEYDRATALLFELTTHAGAEQEAATYYLAESLYQKGDRASSRGYYTRVAANPGG